MDLSEIIKIFDHDGREVPVLNGLPTDKLEYHIKDAKECYARIDENNVMLFHSIDLGEIDICISHYLMDGKTKFYATANRYTLEVHNLLKGYVQYRLQGFEWRRINEGEYNIIYLDEIDNEVHIIQPAITIDFQISKALLYRLAEKYAILDSFAEDLRRGTKASFHTEFYPDSPKAMLLLLKIMALIKKGEGKSVDVKDLAMKTIDSLIIAKTEKFRYRYNYEQIERIDIASQMLLKHMDDENILEKQIARSGFNEAKFREGFKSMFDCTPKHFLMLARMKLAEELVLQGYTLSQICKLLPYHEPKHLEEAFFDTKGYHIKDIRRRM